MSPTLYSPVPRRDSFSLRIYSAATCCLFFLFLIVQPNSSLNPLSFANFSSWLIRFFFPSLGLAESYYLFQQQHQRPNINQFRSGATKTMNEQRAVLPPVFGTQTSQKHDTHLPPEPRVGEAEASPGSFGTEIMAVMSKPGIKSSHNTHNFKERNFSCVFDGSARHV